MNKKIIFGIVVFFAFAFLLYTFANPLEDEEGSKFLNDDGNNKVNNVDKNDEEVGQVLGLKPYAVKMSRQCIAKNGVKFYIGLYQKYIDLDYKIKSGKITPINALYELIF